MGISRRWIVATGLALLVEACGSSTGSPAGPNGRDPLSPAELDASTTSITGEPPGEGMPCDVLSIVEQRCQRCHSDPPRFGAPMPLTARAHFDRPSVSQPNERVYERALDRIHQDGRDRMPPPSQPSLNETELQTLDVWLRAGAPVTEELVECDDTVEPEECVGSACLPCEPTHRFLASNDGKAFHVPADRPNHYQCFAFPSPFASGEQAIAWAPIVDDARVVHHMLLYRTATPLEMGLHDCVMPSDAAGLVGWAPGAGNSLMPENVGLELRTEENEWLILEIHYWNIAGHHDAFDESGLAICTTSEPREQAAGILTLGSTLISLPPRSRDVSIVGHCPASITAWLPERLHILSSAPHMHTHGTRIRTEILRNGRLDVVDPVVDIDPWDFNDQRARWHDAPIVVNPGDTLRTTCVYDNPGSEYVYYGPDTEDEMCFDFALVYPIDAIPRDVPRVCINW